MYGNIVGHRFQKFNGVPLSPYCVYLKSNILVLYFTNLPRCSIAVHDHVSSALVAAGVAIVMVTTVMVTVARAAVAGRGLAAAAARGAVLAVPETRREEYM